MDGFIIWDWKEQLPLTEMLAKVNGERQFLAEVPDTGGDVYALAYAPHPIDQLTAQMMWDAYTGEDMPKDQPDERASDKARVERERLKDLKKAEKDRPKPKKDER